jgi:hypothetical protein
MRTKALDEGNCAAARPGGKEAGVKATSSRTETGCEAGDADELAPHSEVRVSASQVKPGVVSRKSPPLPGETCPAGAAAGAQSAVAGNSGGQRAGVSRGRSSAGNEPGVRVHLPRGALKGPDGLTHARRTELVGLRRPRRPPGWQRRRMAEPIRGGRQRRRKTAVGRIQTSLVDFWITYRDLPAPPVGSCHRNRPARTRTSGVGAGAGKLPRLPDSAEIFSYHATLCGRQSSDRRFCVWAQSRR